jgi:hypothetical protein
MLPIFRISRRTENHSRVQFSNSAQGRWKYGKCAIKFPISGTVFRGIFSDPRSRTATLFTYSNLYWQTKKKYRKEKLFYYVCWATINYFIIQPHNILWSGRLWPFDTKFVVDDWSAFLFQMVLLVFTTKINLFFFQSFFWTKFNPN